MIIFDVCASEKNIPDHYTIVMVVIGSGLSEEGERCANVPMGCSYSVANYTVVATVTWPFPLVMNQNISRRK